MSRTSRAIELLREWRDHPRGCTAEHGWSDGYLGPCTDDPWDIVLMLDDIDPLRAIDPRVPSTSEGEGA